MQQGKTGWIRYAGATCFLTRPSDSVLQVNHLTHGEASAECVDLLDKLIDEHTGIVEVTGVVSRAWIDTLLSLDFEAVIEGGAKSGKWRYQTSNIDNSVDPFQLPKEVVDLVRSQPTGFAPL